MRGICCLNCSLQQQLRRKQKGFGDICNRIATTLVAFVHNVKDHVMTTITIATKI
jgi:hypothetical protein